MGRWLELQSLGSKPWLQALQTYALYLVPHCTWWWSHYYRWWSRCRCTVVEELQGWSSSSRLPAVSAALHVWGGNTSRKVSMADNAGKKGYKWCTDIIKWGCGPGLKTEWTWFRKKDPPCLGREGSGGDWCHQHVTLLASCQMSQCQCRRLTYPP